MAPIQGHLMVPKAMRIVKFAIAQARSLLRTKAPTASQTYSTLNPVRAYTQKTIAIHPTALLKQSKPCHSQSGGSRPYSNAQHANSKPTGPKYNRSSFPTSRTSRTIAQNGTAPFASTLRPNLTGGTLSRSAGGYSLGGAGRARQFSHTSGCQAQVIHNVSAGIRAFLVNGSKAHFDGVDPVTGEKKWRAVTETQNGVYKKWTAAPHSPRGTSLDFQLSPTVTALLPTSSLESAPSASANDQTTLNTTGVLHTLSSDFARALRDLALITHDLSKLAAFGDLPLTLTHTASSGPLLRVRFPGCDADTVAALCDEVDIRRGVIVEDAAWAKSRDADMALLFPFAPAGDEHVSASDQADDYARGYYFERGPPLRTRQRGRKGGLWGAASSPSSSCSGDEEAGLSTLHHSFDDLPTPSSSPDEEGYASLVGDIVDYEEDSSSPLLSSTSSSSSSSPVTHSSAVLPHQPEQEYEGVEGIYRFLQEIDDARRTRR